MYNLFPYILLLFILGALLLVWRRRFIIKKLRRMSVAEKLCRLNELARPFGFEYLLSQDVFTSRKDAWQRDFGYCHAYDKHAVFFNMVIDCEPIYFDYKGCTWLIELWKGQYGVNAGAEIGIYKADTFVPKIRRKSVLFHTVSDEDLPFFEMTLYHKERALCRIADRHWWLAGFRMGEYCEPQSLFLKTTIIFPTIEMQNAFVRGLKECGYSSENIDLCSQRVSFDYSLPRTAQPREGRRLLTVFSQWKNRVFLKLYCRTTKPFCFTMDKLLYLYEYLPFAFRHIMRIHHKKHRRQSYVR